MKLFPPPFTLVGLLLACTLHAQPIATNHVLELDGNGSYVELPPNLFEGIQDFTIEGWVKWGRFGSWSRFFDFGSTDHHFCIRNVRDNGAFDLSRFTPQEEFRVQITIPDLLRTNQWCHLAVVSDRLSTKLYFNGWLLRSAPGGGPLSLPEMPKLFLGRSHFRKLGDSDFVGQIDEFRVWRTARTVAQIREGMNRRATGTEDGLLASWNFEGEDGRDLSSRWAAQLIANARIISAAWPGDTGIAEPAVIKGRVLEDNGLWGAWDAVAQLEQDGAVIAQQTTPAGDRSGIFELAIFNPNQNDYVLSSTWLGRKTRNSTPLRLIPGRTNEVELRFTPEASLAGTVRMFDGTPHVAVPVQIVDASHTVVATALTDALGRYQLEAIKAGPYFLRAMVRDGSEYFIAPNKSSFVPWGEIVKDDLQPPRVRSLDVPPGQTLEKLDFTFAPFKKGTWTTYNEASGLPSNDIQKFWIDPQGLLWIATMNGISQFNGKEFVDLTTDELFLDGRVLDLWCEPNGIWWFCTARGLYRYDPTGAPVSITVSANRSPRLPVPPLPIEGRVRFRHLLYSNVTGVTRTEDGTLWFCRGQELLRFRGGTLEVCPPQSGYANPFIQKIAASTDGIIWLGTGDGLTRYDGTNFVNVTRELGVEVAANCPSVTPDGRVWFGGPEHL